SDFHSHVNPLESELRGCVHQPLVAKSRRGRPTREAAGGRGVGGVARRVGDPRRQAAPPAAPERDPRVPHARPALVGAGGGAALGRRELARAAEIQRSLDELMQAARRRWPLDPMIVNLDGYHLKNAYMVEHWDAIQAGRAPPDQLLDQAERRFFETLFVDP